MKVLSRRFKESRNRRIASRRRAIREALYTRGDFEGGTLAGNEDYEDDTDWSNDNYTDKDIDQEIEKYPYSAAKLDPKKFVKILRDYLSQNTYAMPDEDGYREFDGKHFAFYLDDDHRKVKAIVNGNLGDDIQVRVPAYSVGVVIDRDESWDDFADDLVVQVWGK